jgi:drug/metabolite transporter (DMT)-like permease
LSGAVWAAFSGLGFGVFQTLNRRTVLGLDAYVSTFVQLAIAGVVLVVASLATEDLGQLGDASAAGILWFAAAGVLHFFGGWTFLSLSQKRIGAARTSPVVSTSPVFGVVIAAVTLHESPSAAALAGMLVVMAGVYLVALAKLADTSRPALRDALFGLCSALCWAISPIFIKHALRGLDSPLLGVTIGMLCALAVYAVMLTVTGRRVRLASGRVAVVFQLLAGLFVGLSVWSRWFALEEADVGIVLALALLSVPVVAALSPAVMGRDVERVTPRIVTGSALVVAGALLLVLES